MSLLLGTLFSCSTASSEVAEVTAEELKAQRWGKRVVLIFTQPGYSERLRAQQALFKEDSAGMKERDLVVYSLVKRDPESALQKRYEVQSTSPFTVLLIGKDGGVKRRSEKPLTLEELYTIIDAMPMRQREMGGN